jgi:hypothetical protein
MRIWQFQRRRWNGTLNLDNFTLFLGCLAVCVVDWDSYGSDRCSVQPLTGVLNFFYSPYPIPDVGLGATRYGAGFAIGLGATDKGSVLV